MKFYNRDLELQSLHQLKQQAEHRGVMTVLTGRRRVGKTLLALHHVKGHRFLYLFATRKEEHLLCGEFLEEVKKFLHWPIIGEIRAIKDIFALLLEAAKKESFTLIIDEFQEFFYINPSVYSDFQKLWDLNKDSAKIHVIFIGSVYSLMHKIFEENKQPLFGRTNRILKLQAFALKTTHDILTEAQIFSPTRWFHWYVFTGNMPKYIEILIEEGVKDFEDILDFCFQKGSIFLNEGKNVLIEEFGRDYTTYFSILALISEGKTSRGEMESLLQKDIGGYLQRLEEDYTVITRFRPINAKVQSRNQKYKIVDPFLNFWFRFIYRSQSAIELENFAYVKKIVKREYSTYCGLMLERFFRTLLAETGRFNQIGSYWEKGNQNEIDIVAVNDFEKKILIAETKLNKSRIHLKKLTLRAETLLNHYPGYTPTYLALSVEDVDSIEELLDAS